MLECYWEIFYVNKGFYTTFYMSTSTRFVVYMLHECCEVKQNIVGLELKLSTITI